MAMLLHPAAAALCKSECCVPPGLWHCVSLQINGGLRNVRHPEMKECFFSFSFFSSRKAFHWNGPFADNDQGPRRMKDSQSRVNVAKPAVRKTISVFSEPYAWNSCQNSTPASHILCRCLFSHFSRVSRVPERQLPTFSFSFSSTLLFIWVLRCIVLWLDASG